MIRGSSFASMDRNLIDVMRNKVMLYECSDTTS
jgi:hypothetical protein